MKLLYTMFFLLLICCILTHSEISVFYAFMGLELWYEKMIPTLLPFMIVSGLMVRMQLTGGFTTLVYPIIAPIFRVSRNVCYGMLMGFLCGFPMGAKTVADLYSRNMISKREADFLLAFCNNIGPVYFIGFVLPLLKRQIIAPYVLGMYGIPLLYGLLLRYTAFRSLTKASETKMVTGSTSTQFIIHLDEAIISSVQSILGLVGYMVLFNLLNLIPHIILGQQPLIMAPLFEISGGLQLLQNRLPLYTLLLLPFGGFSCIAQTYSCIKNTDLSINNYVLHKLILVAMTALYYLGWYLSSPASFLR